jgi:hypothetical protein
MNLLGQVQGQSAWFLEPLKEKKRKSCSKTIECFKMYATTGWPSKWFKIHSYVNSSRWFKKRFQTRRLLFHYWLKKKVMVGVVLDTTSKNSKCSSESTAPKIINNNNNGDIFSTKKKNVKLY